MQVDRRVGIFACPPYDRGSVESLNDSARLNRVPSPWIGEVDWHHAEVLDKRLIGRRQLMVDLRKGQPRQIQMAMSVDADGQETSSNHLSDLAPRERATALMRGEGMLERKRVARIHIGSCQVQSRGETKPLEDREGAMVEIGIPIVECDDDSVTIWSMSLLDESDDFIQPDHHMVPPKVFHLPLELIDGQINLPSAPAAHPMIDQHNDARTRVPRCQPVRQHPQFHQSHSQVARVHKRTELENLEVPE